MIEYFLTGHAALDQGHALLLNIPIEWSFFESSPYVKMNSIPRAMFADENYEGKITVEHSVDGMIERDR